MHHASLYTSRNSLPDLSHIDKVDFVEVIEPKLSIGTVRRLIDQAYTQPLNPGGKRAIVVVAEQINVEAQNALLKVLEEPPEHTSFHFVISDHARLLPTLLSRFEAFSDTAETEITVAKDFIKLPIGQRLELVAEKTSAKDVAWQQNLVSGLEQLCLEKELSNEVALEVIFIKKYLQGPGASAKMLLEHLALAV